VSRRPSLTVDSPLTLTTDAVRALAPDASALRSAQSLSSPARWAGLGRNERALWGACQGSGKDPYQVVVDLGGEAVAAKCTCPSRKFPCKHGLGLMLMATTNASALPAGTPPAGAAEWLGGRDARSRSATSRRAAAAEGADGAPGDAEAGSAPRVVDEKARAKRVATRERRVESGLEELRLWLRDLARRGLAEVVTEGVQPFEAMAARLVDAQAASVARSIRSAGWRVAGAGVTPDVADVDWADDLLDVVGRTYLLAETYSRRESLSPAMHAEVRTLVGWTVREAELPEDDVVEDDWLVLGRRHTGDERLRATRTYLRGQATARDAVLLDYAPASNAAPNEPPVGAIARGRLVFYPSPTPLRAAVRGILAPAEEPAARRAGPRHAPASWREALAGYATALGANPWRERGPILVDGVAPAALGEEVLYRDGAGETVPIRLAEGSAESLQAFSGGHPVTLFGEWNGRAFTVLSAGDGEAWVALSGTTDINPTLVVGALPPPPNPAWDALRAYAILGTSRSAAGPELAPLLARMPDRSAEDQLLSLAASLAVRRRAQAMPVARPEATPLAPAPPEVATRASEPAARVLAEWLGEAVVVRDWLDRAVAAGMLVPAELLPQVAQIPGVTRRRDAERVLGRRWSWLAGAATGTGEAIARARAATSVTDFLAAIGDPSGARRYGGELAEVLRPFRAHDAAAARGWLEAAWPVLSAKGRDGAVTALAEGIGPGDARFLDRLIGEEKRARKEDLVTLACRVPGSAVRDRIEARARRLVGIRGLVNRSIDITPPSDDEQAAMEQDGMNLPAYGLPTGMSLRAAAMVEHAAAWHLARVNPSRWLEWLRLKPTDLVNALVAVKRVGYMLAEGLRSAAVGHRDPVIAEALLEAQPTGGYTWLGQGLWPIVREEQRERLMVKVLFDRTAKDWFQIASLQEALEAAPRPWSPTLLTLVRHEIKRSVEHTTAGPAMIGRNRLAVIATQAPTELLTEIEDAVAVHAPRQDNPAAFDDVLRIVVARRSLDAAFAPAVAGTGPKPQP
jgi:Family of unknown function (DUF5691)/SWIM zinc finger